MWDSYSDWDWDYYDEDYDYHHHNLNWSIDKKLLEKYITGFDNIKEELIFEIRKSVKKEWNFSEKLTEEIINLSLESFKNGLVGAYYVSDDDEVIGYLHDIIRLYSEQMDTQIKNSLLNL